MKKLVKTALQSIGLDLVRHEPTQLRSQLENYPELSQQEKEILLSVQPYTMTTVERMTSLLQAVTYVSKNQIPGDIVECGVWRGGSMMIIAKVLLANNDVSRTLYLFDTFEGMSEPTDDDFSVDGRPAAVQLKEEPKGTGVWCEASIEDVRANMISTGYPEDKILLIKGKVEDTIPNTIPKHVALLRLDTDWYESTRHELQHLFPLLDSKGILILDDYGHWQGARKAVDEYFQATGDPVYLHRVDYSARILVRNGQG
ncbi:macrocin O-methyltransferase [Phragmitibacter flavus]|uniref:Macrocin O-methyltransferase n=1 Tax=Phragmitibacter flavus TaxID=2576071 RepID=A0A5R8KF63_9BACT|nr:TylF/MycF/NovP-related O-methyltransferase [Phragmitibacter flavus]TLD70901.1 macrocin O-methyltransferase [Phragmitibacter flavus]